MGYACKLSGESKPKLPTIYYKYLYGNKTLYISFSLDYTKYKLLYLTYGRTVSSDYQYAFQCTLARNNSNTGEIPTWEFIGGTLSSQGPYQNGTTTSIGYNSSSTWHCAVFYFYYDISELKGFK